MLPERHRQLLTAYVDGELSARQRRHVERLLHRSSEARRLLQRLQEDARALRTLPTARLECDLSRPVLRAIAERRLTPQRRRPAVRVAPLPTWAGFAAAAAVLIGLGLASFWYFAGSLDRGPGPGVASRPPHTVPRETTPEKDNGTAVARGKGSQSQGPGDRGEQRPDPPTPAVPPVVKGPGEVKPAPREGDPRPEGPREGDVLTDRMEMFTIDRVDLALPTTLKLHHLDQDPVRQRLVAELARDRDFRLELPCRNGTTAFERLQVGFKPLNLGLVIDQVAQARLKLPQVPTNYALFLENLTADELVKLLLQVGQDDRKAATRKPPESQFDRLVLSRMSPFDRKELSALLGVDPTLSAAPAPTGPLGTDPRQPLADLTAKQVGEALAGQGGTPRPEAGKTPAKPVERQGLVLPYTPVRPHPGSPEIQRFLETRKPARPGTLRILLVLRS